MDKHARLRIGREAICQVGGANPATSSAVAIVTHDADVANHAHRIIEIKDGKILADLPNPSAPSVPDVEPAAETEHEKKRFGLRAFGEGLILVKQSVRSLLANKVRTMLSALGIMIGVAAVIATIAIANGAKAGCPVSRLVRAEITMDATLED